LVEGTILGSYVFLKYKKEEKQEKDLMTFIIAGQKETAKGKAAIERAKAYSEATIIARDLSNEQPTIATPTYIATFAQEIAKNSSQITCKVYDKKEVEKMGMGAFLGIARASETPPKFIHLEYTPKKKTKEKIAIVGKGITYDSGGMSLKPPQYLLDMKMDMAGAAVVLAIFSVITKLQPDVSVVGLIAATSNMVSGGAIVPGDVVRAMNGKTIEIINTDAEGRVTLADALSYAVKEGATQIVDLATLTGAIVIALGEDIAALYANDKKLGEEVKKAAEAAGEKMWEMPLEKKYKELNKSSVADLANADLTRYAGSITAALFLEEFVDGKPWVHLDIAGPAIASKGTNLWPKGGTGFGVRTMLKLLQV
jgi:leucyl aminopeptidase